MAIDELVAEAMDMVKRAEEGLKDLDEMIQILRDAGEDVSELVKKKAEIEARVRTWKIALERYQKRKKS